MLKTINIILLVSVSYLVTGCATILTEDTHKINVATSNGEQISVSIDGQSQSAPGIVSVKKENTAKILVAESQNCTKETQLTKSIEPTFFVNLLSGGVFGSTTDYSTGKMWKYQDTVTISCN